MSSRSVMASMAGTGWREMTLSNATLGHLPPGVAAPGYDRSAITPGIVHIGCGNFHRAHMAVYLHDLFALGLGHEWGILGAGVRDGDARMRDLLAGQDYLSSVIELAPGAQSARVIGAMTGFVPIEADNAAPIDAMSAPAIRIVSLTVTVTEGGYYIDPATGTFSSDHPDIAHDGANPDRPRTAFGAIVAALKRRRDAGLSPLTVMCCDNLPHNGHVCSDAVVGVARLSDPELADWIAATIAFPNSMVDRSTPATGPRELAIARDLGLDDAAPVTCEPFRPMGDGGQLSLRSPGHGKGGRHRYRPNRCVRDDEIPHPEWRSRDHRLSCRAGGYRIRASGDGGCIDPCLP